MNNEEKILKILEALSADIAGLKEGQSSMQADIAGLKKGQSSMQSDIASLKTGQEEIKTELRAVWDDIKRLDKRLTAQDEELVLMKRLK